MAHVIARTLASGGYPQHGAEDRFLRAFSPEILDGLKRDLLAVERQAMSSASPQRFLCAALLDYTETWEMMEVISEEAERAGAEDERRHAEARAQAMIALLAQRYDHFKSPHAFWIGRLGCRVLHKYLETNYPDSLKSAWWDAYIGDVVQRVTWLSNIIYALPLVGISSRGLRNILPDTVILDQWEARMTAARMKALEDPEEFGRGWQARLRF